MVDLMLIPIIILSLLSLLISYYFISDRKAEREKSYYTYEEVNELLAQMREDIIYEAFERSVPQDMNEYQKEKIDKVMAFEARIAKMKDKMATETASKRKNPYLGYKEKKAPPAEILHPGVYNIEETDGKKMKNESKTEVAE
jgi:hypothetical protein